jgi:hypothetical protein
MESVQHFHVVAGRNGSDKRLAVFDTGPPGHGGGDDVLKFLESFSDYSIGKFQAVLIKRNEQPPTRLRILD